MAPTAAVCRVFHRVGVRSSNCWLIDMSNPKVAFALIGVLGVAIVATLLSQSSIDLDTVRQQLDRGEYKEAEVVLEDHLDSNPDDFEAVQLLGEAWMADPRFQDRRGVEKADELLERIPDDHPEALVARKRQAQMALMDLHEVARAEKLVRRALKAGPDDPEANFMMWKVLQLTRRFMYAEPYYQKVYANTPPSGRMTILKHWFVSQFRPFMPNTQYDMALKANADPRTAELERYARFIDNEQVQQLPRVGAAQAHLQMEDPAEAVRLLNVDEVDRSEHEPSYLSVLIDGLVGMGELDRAKKELGNWPEGSRGYQYNAAAALVADEVDSDYSAAIEFYRKCADVWPGPVDLRMQSRYVACLKKAKRTKEAEAAEARRKNVEAMFADQRLQGIMSQCIKALPSPQAIQQFARFYAQLGRDEEAQRWKATMEAISGGDIGGPAPALPGTSPRRGTF